MRYRTVRSVDDVSNVELDVDSILVLDRSANFYKVHHNIEIGVLEEYASSLQNRKLIPKIEEMLGVHDDSPDRHLGTYVDFPLTSGEKFGLYVVLRLPNAALVKTKLRKIFLNICKSAIRSLPVTCSTRKRGSASHESGSLQKMKIFTSDWPDFLRRMHSLVHSDETSFFRVNQIDVLYYGASHGMLLSFSEATDFFQRYIRLTDTTRTQVHVGIVISPKSGEFIVADWAKVHAYFGVHTSVPISLYRPFFMSRFGYFSNVRESSTFPEIEYCHSYCTTAHVLRDKNFAKFAIFTTAMSGQSGMATLDDDRRGGKKISSHNTTARIDDNVMRDWSTRTFDVGHSKIELLREYADVMREGGDFRLEFVLDVTQPRGRVIFDDLNNIDFNDDKFKHDFCLNMFRHASAKGLLIAVQQWREMFTSDFVTMLNRLSDKIDSNDLTCQDLKRIYDTENLVDFYCHGTAENKRCNYDRLKKVLVNGTVTDSIKDDKIVTVDIDLFDRLGTLPDDDQWWTLIRVPNQSIQLLIKDCYDTLKLLLTDEAEARRPETNSEFLLRLLSAMCLKRLIGVQQGNYRAPLSAQIEPVKVFGLSGKGADMTAVHQPCTVSDVVHSILDPVTLLGLVCLRVVGPVSTEELSICVGNTVKVYPRRLLFKHERRSTKWSMVMTTDDILRAVRQGAGNDDHHQHDDGGDGRGAPDVNMDEAVFTGRGRKLINLKQFQRPEIRTIDIGAAAPATADHADVSATDTGSTDRDAGLAPCTSGSADVADQAAIIDLEAEEAAADDSEYVIEELRQRSKVWSVATIADVISLLIVHRDTHGTNIMTSNNLRVLIDGYDSLRNLEFWSIKRMIEYVTRSASIRLLTYFTNSRNESRKLKNMRFGR